MTGCQADYSDVWHSGDGKTLMNETPVREVMIYRHECEHPARVYHQLSVQGATAIQFVPHLQPADARLWGDFLCAVFAIWVKEDVNRVMVSLFEATLHAWRGEAVRYDDTPPGPTCAGCIWLKLCGGGCPQLRLEDGTSALCEGYRQFYSWSAPYMRVMRDLIKQHRSPMELMAMLR
ncbi:radical SAM protein [uncultured Klebsiella sp.]|uniref:radical SAM protein n=1 Tax=uncultured Klebsiella sp. TaxID=284011 RepID=UPI00280418DC|nr:radical SAM protein [uncultured Klebsiella sp.]